MGRNILQRVTWGIGSVLALIVLFAPYSTEAFDVPPNDGFVTDTANILTPEDRSDIARMLREYQEQTSNEIAILIVNTLGGDSIAHAAVEVGRKWGVGSKEKDNGFLLLIAYSDREIFLATGYGLEGAIPDLVAKGIIEEEITPHFREGDYAGGIRAGIEALQKHIGGEYTADRYAQDSGDAEGWIGVLIFFGVIGFQLLVSFLGRSKSWWFGGVLGGVVGVVLALVYAWWWSIPLLVIVGILIDLVASKTHGQSGGRRRGWWIGGGGMGGSRGGGFGGFGGGSFGGGGAGGRW